MLLLEKDFLIDPHCLLEERQFRFLSTLHRLLARYILPFHLAALGHKLAIMRPRYSQ